jgi:multiple sugar transport system substrate-binding protein
VGHWVYPDYRRALGDDLVLIPMPAFGPRPVTGAGSWNFGISADCKDPAAAAEVLAYLMAPAQIQAVTAANGAMPGTWSALRASPAYAPGGPLFVYSVQMAEGLARTRPETPAYPVITMAFAEAVNNILAGAAVRPELDRAARAIDQDLADNRFYPVP